MCKCILVSPDSRATLTPLQIFFVPAWARVLDPTETCNHHWTIWGISLQALAFFLAKAIQGGSSWGNAGGGRPRWEDGVWLESPGTLEPDLSGAVLDEKGGELTVVLWGWGVLDEVVVLERDGGLVQEGEFWGTGTGARGDGNLWGLAVAGGTWGFGGIGQGSDWDLGG